MDIKQIKELLKIMNESTLTELTLDNGSEKLVIKKEVNVIAAPQTMAMVQPSMTPVQGQVGTPAPIMADAETGLLEVKSPMVGTFYTAPSPDAAAYVGVGSTVQKGDVVCIVEAMKLMNEIESDFSGVIAEICVTNGTPVEYGTVLFRIRK
jgi:acetyl-CoA carboxylase biotin carboxyl carrier protein